MAHEFRPDLKAHVTVDEDGRVRQILDTDERWMPSETIPHRAAMEYVRSLALLLKIEEPALDRLHEPVTYTEPRQEGESYRLEEEKRQFDTVTVGFAQTYLNVPVWRTGVTVTIKGEPDRIIESTNTSLTKLRAELPSKDNIASWRSVVVATTGRRTAAIGEEAPAVTPADRKVREALGLLGQARHGAGEGMRAAVRSAPHLLHTLHEFGHKLGFGHEHNRSDVSLGPIVCKVCHAYEQRRVCEFRDGINWCWDEWVQVDKGGECSFGQIEI